jgi:small GTP-binding protein
VVGEGTLPSFLLRFEVKDKNKAEPYVYPVLVTQAVIGKTLKDIFANPEWQQTFFARLDPISFCRLTLLAILTNPGDGNLTNFIAETTSRSEQQVMFTGRLFCVDNDQLFADSLILTDDGRTFGLGVKTILYCFDQMQSLEVSPELIEALLALNPEAVIRRWLNELIQIDSRYRTLFEKEELEHFFEHSPLKNLLQPRPEAHISLIPLAIHNLEFGWIVYEKLIALRIHCLKAQGNNKQITLLTLLKQVEPLVAARYKTVLDQNNKTPNERFIQLEGIRFSRSFTSLRSQVQQLPKVQDVVQKMKFGPVQAKQNFEASFEMKQKIDTFRQQFMHPDAAAFDRAVQMFKQVPSSLKSQLIAGLNFTEISVVNQKQLLKALVGSYYHTLTLQACQSLDYNRLMAILKNARTLTALDLTNCQSILDGSRFSTINLFADIAQTCSELQKLAINQLQGSARYPFTQLQVNFPKLRRLRAADCHSLKRIELQATALQYLDLNGCITLETLSLNKNTLTLTSDIERNKASRAAWLQQYPQLRVHLPESRLSTVLPTEEEEIEINFKVIVVGDYAGKTCLIRRFCDGKFTSNRGTIGVDYNQKEISLFPWAIYRLQLWDIAGGERFGNFTRVYYKDAVAAVIVYDITRPQTLESALKWAADIKEKLGDNIPIWLVANKIDRLKEGIEERRKIGQQVATKIRALGFFECSALLNIGIDKLFNEVAWICAIMDPEIKSYYPTDALMKIVLEQDLSMAILLIKAFKYNFANLQYLLFSIEHQLESKQVNGILAALSALVNGHPDIFERFVEQYPLVASHLDPDDLNAALRCIKKADRTQGELG